MTVTNALGLNDNMTRVLTNIVRTMNIVISTMQRLDAVSNVVGDNAFGTMQNEIRSAEVELKKLQNLMNTTGNNSPPTTGITRFQAKIMSLYSTVQLVSMAIRGLGNIANMADEYVSVNARLSLVNDNLQTQVMLQDKVLKSANSTRSSYKATADLITKIGQTGAIKGNDNQIAFAEKINKLLKIGGGSATTNESALLQLSQSLASGVMQGDEFRSLKENAPALMQSIAKGIGVNQGQLKALSSEGKLTADVIISAINKMGGSIDEQFGKLPRTFGENKAVFVNMVGTWIAKLSDANGALGQLNAKFTQFTNFLSSSKGIEMLNNIGTTLNIIMFLIIGLFNIIGSGIDIISDFGGVWEGIVVAGFIMLLPAIWGCVTALWAMIPPILAQVGLWVVANLPIVLIGLAIGLLIGILIHFGVTSGQVVGFVAGLFGGLVAFLVNIFLFFYNHIMQIVTFFKNIWIDPVFAVQNLFYGMITNVLGFFQNLVNGIIDGLNFIIGVAQKVGVSVSAIEKVDFTTNIKAPTSSKAVHTHENKYLDIGDFSSKSSKFAVSKFDKLENSLDKFSMKNLGIGSVGTASSLNNALGQGKDIGDIGKVGKIGSIEKDVKIADEDIKMLYEMAVGNRVNQINLTVETKAPKIISNNNISKNVDFEELYDNFADKLSSEAQISVKSKH